MNIDTFQKNESDSFIEYEWYLDDWDLHKKICFSIPLKFHTG